MANVLTSPEDAINAALVRIGYKLRIGWIGEGSEAAKVALDIYGQTRDALLRSFDWEFARKSAAAVSVAGAVPPPWNFMYLYPTDCIRVREVFGSAYLANTNDPLPINWARDTTFIASVETEIVLTNISPATLVYTQQVTIPSLWDEGFGESFIDSLGTLLAPRLADLNAAKLMSELTKAQIAASAELDG